MIICDKCDGSNIDIICFRTRVCPDGIKNPNYIPKKQVIHDFDCCFCRRWIEQYYDEDDNYSCKGCYVDLESKHKIPRWFDRG